jgi:hypothetical protein
MKNNVASFYKWFAEWYKTIKNEITIMISVPNELQPYKEENVVILELFKGHNENVVLDQYLNCLLQKAHELGVTIYVEDKEFKYEQFGFELTQNKNIMKK